MKGHIMKYAVFTNTIKTNLTISKTLMLLLLIFSAGLSFGTNNRSIVTQAPVHVNEYHLNQENTLKLQVDYAASIILNKEQRKQLNGQSIYKVDLVYTQFKTDQSFNQQQLNERRIRELKNAIPQLRNNSNIKWTLIEQTGASNKLTAEKFFHGFVVHFGKGIDYQTLKNSYGELQTPFENYTIDAEKGGEINYLSGTVVRFQPNSICYQDGTPVKGEVNIQYREFRDQADIAFSGIPMTFGENGEYNFSSVGMFELRGSQNGKELKLNQPASVDFQATRGLPGVDFYQMDDETGKWERLKEINPKIEERADNAKEHQEAEKKIQKRKIAGAADTLAGRAVAIDWAPIKWTNGSDWVRLIFDDNTVHVTRSDNTNQWHNGNVLDLVRDESAKIWGKINYTKKDIKILVNGIKKRQNQIDDWNNVAAVEAPFIMKDNGNRTVATLLAAGADAGHTYPSMVAGLNTSDFGVYNCDQIYRIPDRIQVLANYKDEATGAPINNKHVLCLIDLDYNGSFSFAPNSFTCGSKANNALALFTSDKKVYLLSSEDYQKEKVNESGSYTFAMKDMTHEIKSTKDLRSWLGM